MFKITSRFHRSSYVRGNNLGDVEPLDAVRNVVDFICGWEHAEEE